MRYWEYLYNTYPPTFEFERNEWNEVSTADIIPRILEYSHHALHLMQVVFRSHQLLDVEKIDVTKCDDWLAYYYGIF